MKLLAVVLLTLVSSSLVSVAQNKSQKAIICLTYDDGLDTQLTTVIPQLEAAGLKATFFLNSIQGASQSDRIGQTPEAVIGWTNAAINGHELGNHTLFHPCPQKLGWEESVAIDGYTIDHLLQEIELQNSILSLIDPGRKERSFAYPCNNLIVSGNDYSRILLQKKLVTFGRAGGDSTSIISDFTKLNRMQVPSWHIWTGTTSSQLIAFAEKVRKAGGLGVYQFHGVGGQVFQISPETHKTFLAYLKSHTNEFDVLTFSGAMEAIAARESKRN